MRCLPGCLLSQFGIFGWFIQRAMRNEARKLAKEVRILYLQSKSRNPDKTEAEVMRGIVFEEDKFAHILEGSRRRAEICCETIQGICYMMALDLGTLKRLTKIRSIQFTYYIDKELEAQGFPPQSKEQKERILEAMKLRIDGWERISGD